MSDDRDETIAPGEDFYRHANGRWLSTHAIPANAASWDSFREVALRVDQVLHDEILRATRCPSNDVERLVVDHYAAGMATAARETGPRASIRKMLENIQDASAVDDILRLLTDLHHDGTRVLWWPQVTASHVHSDRHLLWLLPGEFALWDPDDGTWFAAEEAQEHEAAAVYVAAQLRNAGLPSASAAGLAPAVVTFERRLVSARLPHEKRRQAHWTDNRFAVAMLSELAPGLALPRYLSALGAARAGVVNVAEPHYFRALTQILESTDIRTLRAYLLFSVMHSMRNHLHSEAHDAAFAFLSRWRRGQHRPPSLQRRVMTALHQDLGQGLGQMYVQAAFSPLVKRQVGCLASVLVEEMRRSIRSRPWLSDVTQASALAKLDALTVRVGHPDRWPDWSQLTLSRESFAQNRLAVARFRMRTMLARLERPVDHDDWDIDAHSVNACFVATRNTVLLPAGLLQPPFFDPASDDADNFGALGVVIGHELTHAFDDQGRRFDGHGCLRDWWTAEDGRRFDVMAEKVVSQFSSYPAHGELAVNGKLTLGENIADLGGLELASRAFARAHGEDRPGPDTASHQRFFFSFARAFRGLVTDELARTRARTDPHSPYEWRVRGPLSNLDAFQDAFQLGDDSPALRTRESRIELW